MARSKGVYIFILMLFFAGMAVFGAWQVWNNLRQARATVGLLKTFQGEGAGMPTGDRQKTMQANRAATGNVFIGQLAYQMEGNLKRGLGAYVTGYEDLKIDIAPFSSEQIREGFFENLRVSFRRGVIAFRGDLPEIPVERLDCTIRDLVLDLGALRQQRIVPVSLSGIVVHELVLEDKVVNRALTQASGKLHQLQVTFQEGHIHAEWSGRPQMSGNVFLQVRSDPKTGEAEQVSAVLERVTLNGLPVPKAVADRLAMQINPLWPAPGQMFRIKLGDIQCQDNRFRAGTTKPDSKNP